MGLLFIFHHFCIPSFSFPLPFPLSPIPSLPLLDLTQFVLDEITCHSGNTNIFWICRKEQSRYFYQGREIALSCHRLFTDFRESISCQHTPGRSRLPVAYFLQGFLGQPGTRGSLATSDFLPCPPSPSTLDSN